MPFTCFAAEVMDSSEVTSMVMGVMEDFSMGYSGEDRSCWIAASALDREREPRRIRYLPVLARSYAVAKPIP